MAFRFCGDEKDWQLYLNADVQVSGTTEHEGELDSRSSVETSTAADEDDASSAVTVSSFHRCSPEQAASDMRVLRNALTGRDGSRSSEASTCEEPTPTQVSVSSAHGLPFEWQASGAQVYFDGDALSVGGSDVFSPRFRRYRLLPSLALNFVSLRRDSDDDRSTSFSNDHFESYGASEETLEEDTVFAPNFLRHMPSSRPACSLSDILNETELSERRKEAVETLYGMNHKFITGEEVENPDEIQKNKESRATVSRKRYINNFMNHFNSTCTNVDDALIEELFNHPDGEKLIYGSRFKFKPNTWTVSYEPQQLNGLTTSTIQSIVCAALNSQRHLQWMIGLGHNNEVIGCEISKAQRDKIRQAFDFCTCTGIFPRLPPRLARIRFHVVEKAPKERYVIEITVSEKVACLYQIAPHRICYVEGGEVKTVQGIDEARIMLTKSLRDLELRHTGYDILRCMPFVGSSSTWKEFLAISMSAALVGLLLRRFLNRFSSCSSSS